MPRSTSSRGDRVRAWLGRRLRPRGPVPVPRGLALAGVLVGVWLLGPWVLVLAAAALLHPRVRRASRPGRGGLLTLGALVAALVTVVALLPDGVLPLPPGAGRWVTPSYLGRPVRPQPIGGLDVPQNPHLAPNGRAAMHVDAWSSDAGTGPGPLGDRPEVDTAWWGVEECATLTFDSRGRLVALCGSPRHTRLRVVDPDTLRPLATLELPRSHGDGPPWEDLCRGAYFYLDDQDRAVVITADRQLLVVETRDGRDEPDLTVRRTYDLSGEVPDDDCLIADLPDWSGRVWWVTRGGVVGYVDPTTGVVRARDLGEEVANSLSTDVDGSVYAATVEAFYRLQAGPDGPAVVWRSTYDRGNRVKDGQLSQGSGTTPTVLPGGLLAVTDNADPRMHVLFLRTEDGAEVCRAEVFDDDHSATENSLVAVGPASVVVENNEGYGAPWRAVLGRVPTGGLARVDATGGRCSVAWTSPEIAPSSVAKVSLATGLVYAWTTRSSWWGATAWYLTAIDARTGLRAFSVRAGQGSLLNNHYAAVTLGPDGSAYIATLGGLVRVRDHTD